MQQWRGTLILREPASEVGSLKYLLLLVWCKGKSEREQKEKELVMSWIRGRL